MCTFSFATDTAPNVRSRAKKLGTTGDKRFPNQHKLDWKSYLGPEGSRNLTRVKYPSEQQTRAHESLMILMPSFCSSQAYCHSKGRSRRCREIAIDVAENEAST